ncbi:MAG: helix-turn-helix domain-containing protein [Bacteroidota bacterium]
MITSKSIAVLPFKNLSPDPENEYFSDGMTEELINALSQIDELKVTARTSSFVFKNAKQDIREIGNKLGVSLVLEGSIRKSNERLRINAKLIQTEDGFQIWSENFDRNMIGVFELQDEISLLIADKIREHLGHLSIQDHLVKINTHNIEAYQFYLKGKYQYNKWAMQGFAEAAKEYEKSIVADPSFDLPYFGIGLSYSFLGSWGAMDRQFAFQRVEEYFSRGNQLGTRSAYSYYSMAKHQFWGLWDYLEAYKNLLKANAIRPNDSDTNEFMAEIHILAGNFSTALKYVETSLQIDPLSPSHYYTKANIYYLQGRITEALKTIEKGISVEPTFTIALEFRTACLLQLNEKKIFLKSLASYESPLQEVLELLYTLVVENQGMDIDEVNRLISNMQQIENPPLLAWDLYLTVHSGNLEAATQLLSLKATQKMGQVIYLKYDPLLQPLREIKAFDVLVQTYFPKNILLNVAKKQERAKDVLSPEEALHHAEILLAKIEEEKLYLDVNLGLKDLAEKINLHPNKLSWLLNERVGKNFYNFINSYRLQEFQEKAIDPKNRHLSLLGLAYESGFNSKSVFNHYFKKSTGLTPKAWVRQHQTY